MISKFLLHGIIAVFALTLFIGNDDVGALKAHATGALAIQIEGTRYGFSYGYRSAKSARRRALRECGRGCKIVAVYRNLCAAYAEDKLPGAKISQIVSGARNKQQAEETALDRCADSGGIQCEVRVSACDR